MKKVSNIYLYVGLAVLITIAAGCFVRINKTYKIEKKNYRITQKIGKKLSMKNDIFRLGELKFYVPNYPMDFIQNAIVESENFYEINELQEVDKILPDNPVILDVGANVGNHTLYWALRSPKKAKHIYSFEIIDETYEILKRNIEINNLQKRVTAFDFGLSNVNSSAKVQQKSDSFQSCCAILEEGEGAYRFKKLDDVRIAEKKIDLIKIDVEGQEVKVIEGAKKFLTKYKPLIWVELWPEDTDKLWVEGIRGNRAKYKALMDELGYEMVLKLNDGNFIYQHKSTIKENI